METVLTKTFPPTIWTEDSRGFTLIEMLVVLGIIILISLVAMPTVSSYFQVSLNSATRDLATNTKEAYNSTLISGRVHRIVYDLKDNSFWVESGPSDVLLDTKETKEKEEKRKRFMRSSKEAEKPSSQFNMEKAITRKKINLPRGVEYQDVLTQQSPNPILEGKAYTHFFPHGVTEQTIIHLKDQNKHEASLVISALNGMTDVYDRYVKGEEVFAK